MAVSGSLAVRARAAVNPTLTVLLCSSLAAATAGLGVVPLAFRRQAPILWIAGSNALAAGLMLGAAYALSAAGLVSGPPAMAVGALAGALFILWTHRVSDTEELDLNRLDEEDPVYGYQLLLVSFLHAACEGVAIGVAAAASLPFGILLALVMAVHNIPEATVLGAVLGSRGVSLRHAAALAMAVNVAQILLAVSVFAVISAAPSLLPAGLGFAAGSLVYLTLVELLPQAYRQAGATSIAVVASVALGALIVLESLVR